MAETKIEWADYTFNPWRGCQKVSPGCEHCYADTMSKRNPGTLGVWGPMGTRVVAAESYWRLPVKWDRAAAEAQRLHTINWRVSAENDHYKSPPRLPRPRVFCASLADVFEDWQGPITGTDGKTLYKSKTGGWLDGGPSQFSSLLTMDDVRRRLFKLIDATPNLDWLLVTKRPENIARMMPAYFPGGYVAEAGTMNQEGVRPNVWLGTSVENQATADERIPHLLRVPAAVRFLSMEPLLGPVELHKAFYVGEEGGWEWAGAKRQMLNWIIAGGESGNDARPMHPDWVRSIRDQCQAAGVPFFFKQWGEYLHTHPCELHLSRAPIQDFGGVMLQRVGKKSAGRLLDGRTWDEVPQLTTAQ